MSLRDVALLAADLKRQILVGSAVSLVGLGRGGLVELGRREGRLREEERRVVGRESRRKWCCEPGRFGERRVGWAGNKRRSVGRGKEEGRWAR